MGGWVRYLFVCWAGESCYQRWWCGCSATLSQRHKGITESTAGQGSIILKLGSARSWKHSSWCENWNSTEIGDYLKQEGVDKWRIVGTQVIGWRKYLPCGKKEENKVWKKEEGVLPNAHISCTGWISLLRFGETLISFVYQVFWVLRRFFSNTLLRFQM